MLPFAGFIANILPNFTVLPNNLTLSVGLSVIQMQKSGTLKKKNHLTKLVNWIQKDSFCGVLTIISEIQNVSSSTSRVLLNCCFFQPYNQCSDYCRNTLLKVCFPSEQIGRGSAKGNTFCCCCCLVGKYGQKCHASLQHKRRKKEIRKSLAI